MNWRAITHLSIFEFTQKHRQKPLSGPVRHAIEQAILEQGNDESIASFIEDCILERLGGPAGIVSLIERRIESLNRLEKKKDGINPVIWSIKEKGVGEYDLLPEGTTY